MIATRRQNAGGLGAADIPCLAAAPTFAVMALLTGVHAGGQPDLLCAAAHGVARLSGMTPMYLLMSAFHLTPWVKLLSGRRNGVRRPGGVAAAAPMHTLSG